MQLILSSFVKIFSKVSLIYLYIYSVEKNISKYF